MAKSSLGIIIPTHNAALHIKKCIESITKQTLVPNEIIVVDFNSTDNTLDYLKGLNNPIISIISTNISGIYSAMNIGIKASTSDWLLFLGADDFLYDNKVTENLTAQLLDKNTIVLGNVENINVKDTFTKKSYYNTLSKKLYWRNTIHHQGIVYNKRVFEKHSFNENLQVLADYELNLKLLKENTVFSYTSRFISKANSRGISKNFNKKLYEEELLIKKSLLPTWAYLFNVLLIKLKLLIKG